MPSVTLHNPEDKAAIKRALPNTNQKIITATVARLYVAYPDPNTWTYSGIMGGLAFVQTKGPSSTFLFRIVDLMGSRGIIWEQELYENFEYTQERSFFHTFAIDNCLAAFSFADDQEAGVFYKKVLDRESLKKSKSPNGSPGGTPRSKKSGFFGGSKKEKKPKGKLDKTQIGLPSNFRHLSHIGFDPSKGFNVQNIDPEWKNLFEQLEKMGVSSEDIQNNAEFVSQFVESRGGPGAARKLPAAPASRARPTPTPPKGPGHQRSPSAGAVPPPSVMPVMKPTTKPPPPPPPASRRVPPPPPASRISRVVPAPPSPAPPALPSREHHIAPVVVAAPPSPEPQVPPPTPARSVQAAPPPPPRPSYGPPSSNNTPPPPPPPIRGAYVPAVAQPPPPPPPFHSSAGGPPPPPPPPTGGFSAGGPPPPPPPPPMGGAGGPPPPPPPPPMGGAGGPPPPPPPPAGGASVALPPIAASSGRANLLDSIRGSGGVGSLRKTNAGDPASSSSPSRGVPPPPAAAADEGEGSSGDLALMLAAALQMRKSRVAGSDDEEESDDENWDD
ncbi:hypothetical protein EDD21DRAFT_367517 [Dissophora ornata]|nr:hypothetical protein BGZ58_002749 [Dissophora ornata]KAI8604007.1 hypothetical protein EDD21DRAFT_367517 [Dissophora ornata]